MKASIHIDIQRDEHEVTATLAKRDSDGAITIDVPSIARKGVVGLVIKRQDLDQGLVALDRIMPDEELTGEEPFDGGTAEDLADNDDPEG